MSAQLKLPLSIIAFLEEYEKFGAPCFSANKPPFTYGKALRYSGNPNLWFSMAHFESRNEVRLEGEGKTIEAINTFIESLEKNKVGNIRIGRSGEEKREIKSDEIPETEKTYRRKIKKKIIVEKDNTDNNAN